MGSGDAGGLHGLTAMVTGSSSGIGAAIAREFAAAGADVIVHARSNRRGAEEVAEDVRRLGRRCQVLIADLADPQTHRPLVETAWSWAGTVDVWVNNAGADILTGAAAGATFEEKMERLLQVDVMATIRLSRLVGERWKAEPPVAARQRVLLNMGWDQADTGMEGESGQLFSTAKGAIAAFTRSLARTLAPEIRVNCLAPGWILTAWGAQASPSWQRRAERESLLRRWGTPQDVARAARFLASPAAAFITGQVFAVNGGRA